MKTKASTLLNMLLLHAGLLVFSLSGVCLKLAAQSAFLSGPNLLYYGLALALMGIYAVVWQLVLRRFPLSFAYANKGVGQLWILLWSVLIFQETVNLKTVIGVGIILVGVFLLRPDNVE